MARSGCLGRQAVVIGAGMSGLAAAAALADHFERVIVLDRDELPLDCSPRVGTPQSFHAHGLLGGGQRALSGLFPGIEDDLVGAGAVAVRMNMDMREEIPGWAPFPQRDLGFLAYMMTRPLIETIVRRRLRERANVEVRQRCRVLEILATPMGDRITGIRFGTMHPKTETLAADVVVDASARRSLTSALLRSLGRDLPEENSIGIDLAYTTAVFAIPEDAPSDWTAAVVRPQPPDDAAGAVLLPIEGGRWIVTASGRHGRAPPADDDGFRTFIRSLRTPTIHNAINGAKRLGGIHRFGFPESSWRRYDRHLGLPGGLLPTGDAICRFNPVYGQGMSVAAREASILARLLRSCAAQDGALTRLGQDFLAEATPLIEAAWAMTALPDFAYPQTRGERPADLDHALRFAAALMRVAARDPSVHHRIVAVHNLIEPRSSLQTPELTRRVEAEMAAGEDHLAAAE